MVCQLCACMPWQTGPEVLVVQLVRCLCFSMALEHPSPGHLQVTIGAEVGLGPFLEDIRKPYPDLHAVLSSTTPDFVVAVMCALGAWAQRTKMVASVSARNTLQR